MLFSPFLHLGSPFFSCVQVPVRDPPVCSTWNLHPLWEAGRAGRPTERVEKGEESLICSSPPFCISGLFFCVKVPVRDPPVRSFPPSLHLEFSRIYRRAPTRAFLAPGRCMLALYRGSAKVRARVPRRRPAQLFTFSIAVYEREKRKKVKMRPSPG